MERDGNGDVRVPIGFRFRPTDAELLLHYLKRKVFSLPLPAYVIPEFHLLHSNPSDLPGELKEKRYFFSKRRWNFNCSGDCGHWKPIGKSKQIMAPGGNSVIGVKKSFVFYQGRKLKTQWIMQQFSLVGSINSPYSSQKLMMQVGDWVVCRLYQRKRRITGRACLAGPPASPSSSSCCSGITEVSCNDDIDQEASSHSVGF